MRKLWKSVIGALLVVFVGAQLMWSVAGWGFDPALVSGRLGMPTAIMQVFPWIYLALSLILIIFASLVCLADYLYLRWRAESSPARTNHPRAAPGHDQDAPPRFSGSP